MVIIDKLKRFWEQPYNAQGSVIDWTLFVGLVLIAAFFWSRVIARVG